MTIGALKSPWVLQPVFGGFSILSPSWLWVAMPLSCCSSSSLFAWALSGAPAAAGAPGPAVAVGDGRGRGRGLLHRVRLRQPHPPGAGRVLHTRAEVRAAWRTRATGRAAATAPSRGNRRALRLPLRRHRGGGDLPLPARSASVPELVVTAAKRLQSGRLDAYLAYMLIALIAAIAVVVVLA